MKILKYFISDQAYCNMPLGAKFIKAGVQDGKICLWFETDEKEEKTQKCHFAIQRTGWIFDDSTSLYLDTVFIDVSARHIYEIA